MITVVRYADWTLDEMVSHYREVLADLPPQIVAAFRRGWEKHRGKPVCIGEMETREQQESTGLPLCSCQEFFVVLGERASTDLDSEAMACRFMLEMD